VLHPFVRIHIVDMETKKYLAKEKPHLPGVANIEHVSHFKIENDNQSGLAAKTTKKPFKSKADFLLPMSTKMYDMRI
jgi:hypothetical protein